MSGNFPPGGAGRQDNKPGAKFAAESFGFGVFAPGTRVRVRGASLPGHIRTPYFLRGHEGVIESVAGKFPNPEDLAYGRPGMPPRTLYRVAFRQPDLWPAYAGSGQDTLIADIFEHWLDERPS
ncbi:MAG: nitrile hydratase subunit beta [Rhodospirillales bacterium]|nr:nitrile hydratase subunit beta [Rhodospirillales bacterium]